jgi:hypothetical protein
MTVSPSTCLPGRKSLLRPSVAAGLTQPCRRFTHSRCRNYAFPSDTAVRLAELRVITGLKMPDCCVLLAAENAAASVASFDERLAQAADMRNLPVLPG